MQAGPSLASALLVFFIAYCLPPSLPPLPTHQTRSQMSLLLANHWNVEAIEISGSSPFPTSSIGCRGWLFTPGTETLRYTAHQGGPAPAGRNKINTRTRWPISRRNYFGWNAALLRTVIVVHVESDERICGRDLSKIRRIGFFHAGLA